MRNPPANKIGDGKSAKAGRPKGSVNKTTAAAKSMLEQAAADLGGVERMVEWAKELPENERAFWSSMWPKLLPLQVNGPGPNGEHTITQIERIIVKAANQDT